MRWSFPLAWALTVVAARPGLAAPPPEPVAKIDCPKIADPGRLRCEIEVRPPPGASLKWADVTVAEVPPFATALRARVGPPEATTHEDNVWRWAIALAARARGAGDLVIHVRTVTCVGDACQPIQVTARAAVTVGD